MKEILLGVIAITCLVIASAVLKIAEKVPTAKEIGEAVMDAPMERETTLFRLRREQQEKEQRAQAQAAADAEKARLTEAAQAERDRIAGAEREAAALAARPEAERQKRLREVESKYGGAR